MTTKLYVPDSFDWDRLLRISTAAIDVEGPGGSSYRRDACFDDPLLFALVYLPHHLSSPATKGRISLNDFHLAMCDDAIEIARRGGQFGPSEKRDAWVGPRDMGKSTWGFCIIPIWLAAYRYRKFIAMFADSGPQAKMHLDTILQELTGPTDGLPGRAKLQQDFPDLCSTRTEKGGNTAAEFRAKNGATFMARGIDSSTLGAKAGNVRPDYIVLDDIEPPGDRNYSDDARKSRQDTILNAIMPMNVNAAVMILGTAVRYNSIVHNFVRHAIGERVDPLVVEENINVHYFPAIIRNPDGSERSLWPERWAFEWLNKNRHKKSFALMYMNNPITATIDEETGEAKGEYWEEDDFNYKTPWVATDMVLVLDPAATAKATSDFTGIAIVSTNAAENRVCVEEALGLRYRPKELREWIKETLSINTLISRVLLETNQGGMWLAETIKSAIPRGVKLETVHESQSKRGRVRQFLWYDEEGWVTYRERFPALHSQQINFSNTPHDDIVDAAAKGVHYWLADNRPGRR